MTKSFFALFPAAVLLLLCACGQREPPKKPDDVPCGSLIERPEPSAPSTEEWEGQPEVSELYSIDGVYTNGDGTEYEYSYHIPQLTAKTQAANEINREIAEYFSNIAEDVQRDEQIRADYGCSSIGWECHRNGNLLSLVVNISYDWDWNGINIYNYDIGTEKRLYDADIIALKGLSEERYLDALRRAAVKHFDETYLIETGDDMYAPRSPYSLLFSEGTPEVYLEKRVWTLSSDNLALRAGDTYLDENGDIAARVHIASFAGAESFETVVTLDPSVYSAPRLEASFPDILIAEVSEGELTITFEKTDTSDKLFYQENGFTGELQYNEKQPVHGLYSTIKEIFCGYLPGETVESAYPYIFLITEEGYVEYVDVISCVLGGYLCVSDPLPWLNNVISFDGTLNAENKATVFALDSSGRESDLASIAFAEQKIVCFKTEGEWAIERSYEIEGDTITGRLALINRNAEQISLNDTVYENYDFWYVGSFTYLGMTEDGAVYYYKLTSEDGRSDYVYEGVAAFSEKYVVEGYSEMNKLFVKELGGKGLVSTVIGETTGLVETMG